MPPAIESFSIQMKFVQKKLGYQFKYNLNKFTLENSWEYANDTQFIYLVYSDKKFNWVNLVGV